MAFLSLPAVLLKDTFKFFTYFFGRVPFVNLCVGYIFIHPNVSYFHSYYNKWTLFTFYLPSFCIYSSLSNTIAYLIESKIS